MMRLFMVGVLFAVGPLRAPFSTNVGVAVIGVVVLVIVDTVAVVPAGVADVAADVRPASVDAEEVSCIVLSVVSTLSGPSELGT